MTEVVRDIEISHWGNVRIEESFLLQHDGAKLKGAYEVGMYDRVKIDFHLFSRNFSCMLDKYLV